jgi:pimeloyl-ACP methyl ester carboxylesterase
MMRDLMNALGHDRATFVGQSFGGGVAMQIAYQYPERCERLVLVNSGGLGREVHPLLRAVIDPGGQTVCAADRLYLAAQMPTLIVWGARDPFIPVRHARAAHATVPGSRLEIFEEVGHYPHCEAPARFVRVLLEFIDSTAPARVSERQWRELFQPPREVELSGSRSH